MKTTKFQCLCFLTLNFFLRILHQNLLAWHCNAMLHFRHSTTKPPTKTTKKKNQNPSLLLHARIIRTINPPLQLARARATLFIANCHLVFRVSRYLRIDRVCRNSLARVDSINKTQDYGRFTYISRSLRKYLRSRARGAINHSPRYTREW